MRKLLVALLAVALIALAAWLAVSLFSLERLVAQEDSWRLMVRRRPVLAALAGLGVYTLLSLVPGTGGKSLVAGWLFGFLPALLVINGGMTIAAVTAFFISRTLVRRWVHRRYGSVMRMIDEGLRDEGVYYMLAMRLLPIPFTAVNYSLGATDVRPVKYWWTTQLGLLPSNAVYAWAGAQLPTLRALVDHGPWQIFTPRMLMALVTLSLFPLLVTYAARSLKAWARRRRAPSSP